MTRMRVLLRGLAVWALALGCAGCRPVSCEKPVGLREVDLTSEQGEWAGTWLNSEGESMLLEVSDAAHGGVRVGFWEDRDGTRRMKWLAGQVRATADTQMVNLVDPDAPAGQTRYVWARVERRNRELLAWLPDADRVAKLVEAGTLPGKAEKDGPVVLGPLTEAQQQRLAGEEGAPLFSWDQPLVLFRAK